MPLPHPFKKISTVIVHLMVSDIFISTGFGLVAPIIAIYFKDNLTGGTIFTAGLASTIYFVSKSLTQLPFSIYVDKHSQKDGLKWMIFGTAMVALVPFIYIFSTHIYHIFIAQVIYGVGNAIAYSTWLGLWSTHLDKHRESFEWSLYSMLTDIGTAISATLGALIADMFGYKTTFLVVGIMSFFGCALLIRLKHKAFKNSVA